MDLKKSAIKKIKETPDEEILAQSGTGIFDFSNPFPLGIFAAAFTNFCLNLIREAIDTVQYLVDYAGYYRVDEIIYITACYIFLLLELFACHAICCLLRNLAVKTEG